MAKRQRISGGRESGINWGIQNKLGTESWIILDEKLNKVVVEAHRKNDSIIRTKIACGEILNVVNVYAPQPHK